VSGFGASRLCSAPLRKSYALRCVRDTRAAQLTENFNSLMASKCCTPPPTRLVV